MDLDHSVELRDKEKDKMEEVKDAKEKRIRVEGSFLAITSATVTCSCRHTKPGIKYKRKSPGWSSSTNKISKTSQRFKLSP